MLIKLSTWYNYHVKQFHTSKYQIPFSITYFLNKTTVTVTMALAVTTCCSSSSTTSVVSVTSRTGICARTRITSLYCSSLSVRKTDFLSSSYWLRNKFTRSFFLHVYRHIGMYLLRKLIYSWNFCEIVVNFKKKN